MIFETHCHLDDNRFDDDRLEVIERLRQQGIVRLINVGYDLPSSQRSIDLAATYSEVYAAVGIHPHDVEGLSEDHWQELFCLAKAAKVVALGEIGLDYYRDLSPRDMQREAFVRQLQMANELRLPVIIHNREAHQEVISSLRANRPFCGGVMHCFSGSWEIAKAALDMGFFISFAGPVTYKNARNLHEVASKIPLDRLLVETDCPYLPPEPFRGKRNEPSYVRYILEKISELKGVDFEFLAEITARNGARLFRVELE